MEDMVEKAVDKQDALRAATTVEQRRPGGPPP